MNLKRDSTDLILPKKINKAPRLENNNNENMIDLEVESSTSGNDTMVCTIDDHEHNSKDRSFILISDDESICEAQVNNNSTILNLEQNNDNNKLPILVSAAPIDENNDNDEVDSHIDLTLRNRNELDVFNVPSSPSSSSLPLPKTSSFLSLINNDHVTSTLNTESQIEQNDQSSIGITQQDMILPNYDSLTMPELRNVVKKYGFKPKDRQTMITILQNVHKFLNQPSSSSSPTTTTTTISTSQSESNNKNNNNNEISSTSYIPNMEFANHITQRTELWESILRYEAVKFDECFDGLDKKKKDEFRNYLDKNALIYKPPKPKRKKSKK